LKFLRQLRQDKQDNKNAVVLSTHIVLTPFYGTEFILFSQIVIFMNE